MANKSISQLVRAEQVTPLDLFVLEQSGTAKKLTGQTLENWLLSFAGGHGGIQSIDKQGTSGLVDTYRITLSDASTVDFTVTNGKGVSSVTKQSTSGLVDTYRMNYTDGTSTTFTVTNGEKGDKGDQTYVWIKWASTENPTPGDLSDYPEEYIGIYTGTASTAPTTPSSYRWYKYKGETGDRGDDAEVVEQKVEYAASADRTTPPDSGWVSYIPEVRQGEFLWSKTTIRFNSGDATVTYGVSYQGMDGSGAVSTVNNVQPVGGNITLTAADVGAVSTGDLLNLIYPIGSVYMSMNSVDPGQFIGGSWTRIEDRFLLGVGDSYTANTTGGSATVTLTEAQIPSHTHDVNFNDQNVGSGSGTSVRRLNTAGTSKTVSSSAGDGGAHNNMPPYQTVYMWQRIA